MNIRLAHPTDTAQVLRLYQHVARAAPGGLARLAHEIEEPYVRDFLQHAEQRGVALVAVDEHNTILGEIHAYTPGIECFAHVYGDLTIAVDPQQQGAGLGRQLFEALLHTVRDTKPAITRIELVVRESNTRAIRFYKALGFEIEGRFEERISDLNGGVEADIPMAWRREAAPPS